MQTIAQPMETTPMTAAESVPEPAEWIPEPEGKSIREPVVDSIPAETIAPNTGNGNSPAPPVDEENKSCKSIKFCCNRLTRMDVWGFAYAATVTTGGVIGYAKAGSTVSLVMGLLFGSLSAVGSYQISRQPKDFWLLFCTSGFLTLLMGYRAFNAGKFMPAGLVAVISLLTVLRLCPRILM